MNGIQGDLGEIKIELKEDGKLVKHQPYRINPCMKQNVKKEIDRMLNSNLMFPESD